MTIDDPAVFGDFMVGIAGIVLPTQIVLSILRYPKLQVMPVSVVIQLGCWACFLFFCGAGHAIRGLGMFDSQLYNIINICTAAASIATALCLLPFIPMLARQLDSAVDADAIMSSLFPASIRYRLLEHASNERGGANESRAVARDDAELENKRLLETKPIADLFPNVTVMLADIAGFTAWSSVREPSQVFILLEQIYGSFDTLVTQRGVFKVETIGDCYVAVAGLPEEREDHAVVMVHLARDCLKIVNKSVRKLEVRLGPDTADLAMRFGLHSGPVTAGVLRGAKSRFQLFGDTVNTTTRIENTGIKNRIHVSPETANLLIEAGYSTWVKPRKDHVEIRGKGFVQTYWVDVRNAGSHTGSHTGTETSGDPARLALYGASDRKKVQRLIDWNVDVLQRLLQQIVAMREPTTWTKRRPDELKTETAEGTTVLDEMKEIISLPGKAATYRQNPGSIELDPKIKSQLRAYVEKISMMYRPNAFHSFEHASHVVQAVTKLLARVVTPDSIDYKEMTYNKKSRAGKLHEFTYGITSDPIIQFACAFSALIHDVDHTGVPNVTLIKEDADIAQKYRYKSVAEQNSVDLSWDLLNHDNFKELRQCIYTSEEEMQRFRQLVVNSVMATDIADKDLGALRKARWDKAFNDDNTSTISGFSDLKSDSVASDSTTESGDDVNRKATIVIEHLIQAADVSHTMQHWHVYLKWNERLFHEVREAYLEGRVDTDPAENWYQGELGFFDFYLIPLGKKLAACGVFGVSSDEYLNYAYANRKEWKLKGEEVVKGYLTKYEEVEDLL